MGCTWDLLRMAMAGAFAFLITSYPAGHADVWLHLATGRAMVQGDYSFGTDPFSYATAAETWVNHSWLFDVTIYGVHQSLGSAAMVLLKALVAAGSALWLLGLSWSRPQPWLAAVLTIVAWTALGPYFLLRPLAMTVCFLALTYSWLERHRESWGWKQGIPLLLIFAVWANVDEWFLLGPALVAVWWLGSRSRSDSTAAVVSSEPATRRHALAILALLGALAGLLNPHHGRAFMAPTLVDPTFAEEWLDDPGDRELRRSPLTWLTSAATLRRPDRLAYAALVLVGMLSFLLQGRKIVRSRFLLWLALLALSVWRSGTIPFFAVLAAPIAALNIQDWLQRRRAVGPLSATAGAPPDRRPLIRSRWILGSLQLTSVLLLAGAGFAAWCGAARGVPGEACSWAVRLDPSLAAAATQLAHWHEHGERTPHARALPTSSAAAAVLAWLCPNEKSLCDQRHHLFRPETRNDFADLRRFLFSASDKSADPTEWRALLKKHKITFLIVDDADDAALARGLRKLFASRLWNVQHLFGRTAVFTARDDAASITAAPVDVARRAWTPTNQEQAPPDGLAREPQVRDWWHALTLDPPMIEPGGSEALVWQAYFDGQRETHAKRQQAQWFGRLSANLVTFPAADIGIGRVVPGVVVNAAGLNLSQNVQPTDQLPPLHSAALQVFQRFRVQHDDGPPGALFLAIRAARRAIRVDPEDARAWLQLGEAYLRLRQSTYERTVRATFEPLDHVRRIQAATALRFAVRLRPEWVTAHEYLAALYQESGAIDLAHEHMLAILRLLGTNAADPGVADEMLKARLKFWTEQQQEFARRLRDAQIAIRTPGLDRLQQAQRAASQGLPALALELLPSDFGSLGGDGFLLKLKLLLDTGQCLAVRQALTENLDAAQAPLVLRELQMVAEAALGDYARADQDLRIPDAVAQLHPKLPKLTPQAAVGWIFGKHVLDRAVHVPLLESTDAVRLRLQGLVSSLRQAADVNLLRGLLALEAGDVKAAETHLRRAVAQFDDLGGNTRLARHYLEIIAR